MLKFFRERVVFNGSIKIKLLVLCSVQSCISTAHNA